MKPWSTTEEQLLRKLWLEGKLSATGIGCELRRNRSAILGKLFRMGLLKSTDRKCLNNSHSVPRPRNSWVDNEIDDSDEFVAHVKF